MNLLTTSTAFLAASSRLVAVVILNFFSLWLNSSNIFYPIAALVPYNLATSGTLSSTYVAALIIPSAMTSHLMIPPNILIRIVETLGWLDNISNAVLT